MPRVTITVPEKTAQPYRFKLDRKVVTLGRAGDNDIVVDSGSVSGKHAEMLRVEGGYQLVDLGSTNGIKQDGNRKQKITLRSGMSVQLGDVAFDFALTEEELEVIGMETPVMELPPLKEKERVVVEKKEEVVTPIVRKKPKSRREPVAEEEQEERAPRNQRPAYQSSGSGFGMTAVFLIMAAAAFFIGMAIHYEKQTGESLIKAIKNKHAVEEAAPAAK